MSPYIQKTLLHFAKLAALGAGTTLIAGLLIFINGVNIATIPLTYQIFAVMLIPMVVGALKQAQTELDAELAKEQAAKAAAATAVAQAQVVDLQAKVVALTEAAAKTVDVKPKK